MNFKIGDIVTGKKNNGCRITTDESIMRVVEAPDLYGEIVVEIIKHNKYPEEIGERYNIWSKEITLFKEQKNEIIIYQKDNKVIAEHKKEKIQAIARCHPDDEFNFMTGAKLALERLDEMLKPPLYYVKFANHSLAYLNIRKTSGLDACRDKKEDSYHKTKFTLDEIKAMNPNYLPFAVRVEEDE